MWLTFPPLRQPGIQISGIAHRQGLGDVHAHGPIHGGAEADPAREEIAQPADRLDRGRVLPRPPVAGVGEGVEEVNDFLFGDGLVHGLVEQGAGVGQDQFVGDRVGQAARLLQGVHGH